MITRSERFRISGSVEAIRRGSPEAYGTAQPPVGRVAVSRLRVLDIIRLYPQDALLELHSGEL